jgi:hypothetical protein
MHGKTELKLVFMTARGIAKAKAAGVYKGRPASMDATQVRAMKAQGLGASEIAKALKIGRASVYPGAGSRLIRSAPPMAGQIAAERIESARVSVPGEVFRQPTNTRKPDSPFNGRKLFWDTTAYRPTAVPFETY